MRQVRQVWHRMPLQLSLMKRWEHVEVPIYRRLVLQATGELAVSLATPHTARIFVDLALYL